MARFSATEKQTHPLPATNFLDAPMMKVFTMSKDLGFDFSLLQLNDVSELHVCFPDGRPCYLPKMENGERVDDETKPILIRLYGSDSPQARKALMTKIRKQDTINRKRHKDTLPNDADIEALRRVNIEFVAELTCGWENFNEKFTREQAVEFYSKYPVVYEQVDKHIGDRTNYVKK